ncbi:MAG: OmpA family protein [Bacteroidetes bacterium]|nr:OmpA family protein [Bacteroidota bacterium]
MPQFLHYFAALLLFGLTTGCVVTKKSYDELLAEKVKSDAELAENQENLARVEKERGTLHQQTNQLIDDTTVLGKKYRRQNQEFTSLVNEQKQLEKFYNDLLTNSGKMNQDLGEQRKQLVIARKNYEMSQLRNDELNFNLEERAKHIEQLEMVLEDREQMVNQLKIKVSKALTDFDEGELKVEIKNGKVYVSLAEKLLFKSYSIEIDKKGISALNQLATVLLAQKDVSILIEGHTDNVQVSKTSQFMKDNWDLSVLRATSIAKILIKAGVNPHQITAAGKGEFSPVEDNSTKLGKQQNRRTEIILAPKLDELFQILEAE